MRCILVPYYINYTFLTNFPFIYTFHPETRQKQEKFREKLKSKPYQDSSQVQQLLLCPPAPHLQIFTAAGAKKSTGIHNVQPEYTESLLEKTGSGFLRSWSGKIFLFPVILATGRKIFLVLQLTLLSRLVINGVQNV